MIVSLIEILTEYFSIILCMHKAAKKEIETLKYVFLFFLVELLCIYIAEKHFNQDKWIMLSLYVNFFVYAKTQLCKKWAETVRIFGTMLLIIPSLQLIVYYATKFVFDKYFEGYGYGIIINCLVCAIILCWKENYFYVFAKKILKSSGFVIVNIYILLFAYLLYIYNKFHILNPQVMIQSLAGIIGLGIVVVILLNSENEKRRKTKELRLYELYNKTFEEAIQAIRTRQHEFDNHINAIKCLQFAIDNPNDLAKAQSDYCDKVLNENSFNRLLKLNMEPILTGFLYSKFMNAKEQGITIIHEIHVVELKNEIEVNEIIEILGILIDNAVEALMLLEDISRIIIVKIIQKDGKRVSIEVANRSRKYLNSEIEKFCTYGYSTKGEKRGIGLARVKKIVKRHKANFYIENINYNEDNYLSFKIIFQLK